MEEPEITPKLEAPTIINSKKNTGLVVALIVFIIISLGLGSFIIYDMAFSNIEIPNNNLPVDLIHTTNDENNLTYDGATTIEKTIQNIYNEAYDAINEGSGIINLNAVEIQIGKEGTVGGISTIKAYKLDFSEITQYFTERGLNFIKTYFTDTPYGHTDGNYYIYVTENERSYNKKGFMNTIFGVTDQGTRNLSVISSSEDTATAVSNSESYYKGFDEYIVFKKVNEQWKIDMFEEF